MIDCLFLFSEPPNSGGGGLKPPPNVVPGLGKYKDLLLRKDLTPVFEEETW